MKGQTSFFIKGVYMIIVLIVVAIVINRIVSMNLALTEQGKSFRLRDKAGNIMGSLAASSKCLAYEERGTAAGSIVDLSTHKVLDKEKLDSFVKKYSEIEPDCMRDFNYGYRIYVKTLPINMTTEGVKRAGGVFEDVLELIDGKRVIFVMDVTGSMSSKDGRYKGKTVTKLECVKIFMKEFIDRMSDDSVIALYVYSYPPCPPEQLFPFTPLPGSRLDMKKKVEGMSAGGGTPMSAALNESFNYGEDNDGEAIVLLTDGRENKCPPPKWPPPNSPAVARIHKNSGIPVYTVSFGFGADKGTLKDVAEISGGEFFDAETCGELITEPKSILNVTIEPKTWEFGDSTFSEDEAFRESISIALPVMVYYNRSTLLPGRMKITLVEGELEEFVGFIEKACSTESDLTASISVSYPTTLEVVGGENSLCMAFKEGKKCQKLACDEQIEFEGITPGNYIISATHERDVLKIIT